MDIKVTELNPHPLNSKIYAVANIAELAEDIQKSGWIKPLTVVRENNAFTIVSGHRRHQAAISLNLDVVPCEVVEFEHDWQILERLLLENQYRQKDNATKLREYPFQKQIEAERAKVRQVRKPVNSVPENFPEQNKGEARDKAAETVGIGSGKTAEKGIKVIEAADALRESGEVVKADLLIASVNKSYDGAAKLLTVIDKIDEKTAEELEDKIATGQISVGKALNNVKKEQKKKLFNQKKEAFEKRTTGFNVEVNCYVGSCIDFLKNFNQEIDLVVSDPPYAMDYKSGWNDWDRINGDKRKDTIPLLDESFNLLHQKMKEDAHIYIFGNPNEIENVKPIFEKYFILKNILIWDRGVIGMGDLKTYGRSYDIIYFGYKSEWKDLNGVRDRDVLTFNRVSPGELLHPTEKPLDILEYLIKKSSIENDVVVDPFAGSCSTLKAAYKLGRNSYGSELEQKYVPSWM